MYCLTGLYSRTQARKRKGEWRLPRQLKQTVPPPDAMDDLTAGMTLDEQIGQLFVVGFPGQDANPLICSI